MYEIALSYVAPLADATSDNTLKGALVGGVCLVLAAAVTAFGGRLEHEPAAVKQLRETMASRITDLERTLDQATRGMELRSARIDQLERFCYLHNVDPNTGKKLP